MKRYLSRTVLTADGIHPLSVVEISESGASVTPFDCEREATSYIDTPVALLRADADLELLSLSVQNADADYLTAVRGALALGSDCAYWTEGCPASPVLVAIDCNNKKITTITK